MVPIYQIAVCDQKIDCDTLVQKSYMNVTPPFQLLYTSKKNCFYIKQHLIRYGGYMFDQKLFKCLIQMM